MNQRAFHPFSQRERGDGEGGRKMEGERSNRTKEKDRARERWRTGQEVEAAREERG